MTTRPAVDPAIPAPESLFGFAPGSRPARYADIATYLGSLAQASDRAALEHYGVTSGGRKLLCLTVSSPKNLARLSEVRATLQSLTEKPLPPAQADAKLAQLPAVVWMGYGIHGDEISGPDAAVELAYRLCAGKDDATRELLDRLVIHIDPMANPDGRERCLAHLNAFSRACPVEDVQDVLHTQSWPEGRGNHYLFDLNRDAIFTVQQESRARVAAIARAQPQYYVDAHEMAPTDTYLFAVPAEPLNPHLPAAVHESWAEAAAAHGAAFDGAGVSFYTRSWNEVFYPGFFDIWPAYRGAVPVLYEQAATSGTTVRLPNGKQRSYADAVGNQLLGSFASLNNAAEKKSALLRRWADFHHQHSTQRAWLVLPSDAYKSRCITRILAAQRIRVERLVRPLDSVSVHGHWEEGAMATTLPAGTLLIRSAQPFGAIVRNLFDFHVPLDPAFVRRERQGLDLGAKTLLFDVTAWSLPLAFAADVRWSSEVPAGEWSAVEPAAPPRSLGNGRYGYVVSDPSLHAAARLLARGIKVRVGTEAFTDEGVRCEPGTLLIRHDDQGSDISNVVAEEHARSEAHFTPAGSARILDGPDLGGSEFRLLTAPRVAVLIGQGTNAPSSGALWHLFDAAIGMPAALLDLSRLGSIDLSGYNVIVVPDASDAGDLAALLQNGRLEQLRGWIGGGGTLIGVGAGALAMAKAGLTSTRPRQAVIERFPPVMLGRSAAEAFASDFARASGALPGAPVAAAPAHASTPPVLGAAARAFLAEGAQAFHFPEKLASLDEWLESSPGASALRGDVGDRVRRYLPRGAYLRADLRPLHWLRYGAQNRLPVLFRESDVLIAGDSSEVVGRYASPAELALSGLVWPEAVGYIAGSAWLVRERMRSGQVVLFGSDPQFRGYSLGTQRLFLNAAILGPAFRTA